MSIDAPEFGALLKRYRLAAGLSQNGLAEEAGLSARALSALERGERRTPYRATVQALVAALDLSGAQRALLEGAVARARGPRGPGGPTAGPSPGPLPLPPTPLVGRARELETAQHLVRSDTIRLLTITGPAGVGKTRLALAVAREVQAAFVHGVTFVDLAPLRDPGLVLSTIARALDVRERERQALPATLEVVLRDRQLLLVLDNFEQVLAAAPHLAALFAACPGLKLLVTSRARLQLRWEHSLPVPPLAVPEGPAPPMLEALASVPAVALFVERARASNGTFALTVENAPAVAALCRHLEGLPLAIELAAARANVLTPAEILNWAERRLSVLGWEAPDVPARQRSLREALAWSHRLLPTAEQALFRRLAVFSGGWTPDAVETVAQTRELGLDAVAGLTRLVDASLAQRSHREEGGLRFSLLETVREFAWEQLQDHGEPDSVQRRHAEYFLALVERAEPALKGPAQVEWYGRLQREEDNLRAALEWAAQQGEVEVELRSVGSLAYFWWESGVLTEGRAWLEHALARSVARDDGLRCRALEGAGLLATFLGDYAGAAARLEEALDLARKLGDGRRIVGVLGRQAFAAWLEGRPERARALAADLEAARHLADPWSVALALHGLGLITHEGGAPGVALAYLEEALALFRRVGDRRRAVDVLGTLAAVAHAQGSFDRAADLATEALRLGRDLREPRSLAWCTAVAVRVSVERGPSEALARRLGAIDAVRDVVGFPRSPHQRQLYERAVTSTRAALGEQTFAGAWAEGRTIPLEQLITEVLAALKPRPLGEHTQPTGQSRPRSRGLLSRREQEVLPLVAEGLTNQEIAERLVISPSTAKYHLSSLLHKLGAENRTQAVVQARQQGLL